MITFIHIPENEAYYRAQEDCCYTVVSYNPKNLGVISQNDNTLNALNSWDLACHCDLKTHMIVVNEKEYLKAYYWVNWMREKLGLKSSN